MERGIISDLSGKQILIVTGELSGEVHASQLVRAVKSAAAIEFTAIGSKRLEEEGAHILFDYKSISVTGLSEILGHLKEIVLAYKNIKAYLRRARPDLLILVDFPGFNLRLANIAKKLGIPVIYFIPPQIWAWRAGRIKRIRESVDKVICILPFEKELYEKYGVEVTYVGHPFVSAVKPRFKKNEFFHKIGIKENRPVLTIMPGSRSNEVNRHMPLLLPIIDSLKGILGPISVLLPLAESMDHSAIRSFLAGRDDIKVLQGLAHDALSYSDAAIIASGSATLEAALLGTPTLVIYRLSPLSYFFAKKLVKISHISLANIVAGHEVFPEFIQDINPEDIAKKAASMIKEGRIALKNSLDVVRKVLSGQDSYMLAGKAVINFLEDHSAGLPSSH